MKLQGLCQKGCLKTTLGMILNKMIFEAFITAYFGEMWHVPIGEISIVFLAIFISAVIAVYGPAKRMRNMAIIDTIGDLKVGLFPCLCRSSV